ncbi:MAG: RNA polymerase sigma factor [Ruminococcus sp.]
MNVSLDKLRTDEFLLDLAAYRKYQCGDTNCEKRKKMKKILYQALESELTDKQRVCIEEYYLNGKKMREIAEAHSLNPSTVTRHIKRATEKLRHIASYY